MDNGTPRGLVDIGRGGACVPARVALQGRIRRSIPRAQYVCFWYGNATTRTFGRAHRHRPYAFCLRELRVNIRPYGFVWADCTWTGIQVFVCPKSEKFHKKEKERTNYLMRSLRCF